MKATITLRLNKIFYNFAGAYALNRNADISIHEFFRDQFVYATFKTVNIQQNSITGVYTLTVEPSVKDTAPLTTLIDNFCSKMYDHGVLVDGYMHPAYNDSVDATDAMYNLEALLSDGKLLRHCTDTDENFTTDGDCMSLLLEARAAFDKLVYIMENAD